MKHVYLIIFIASFLPGTAGATLIDACSTSGGDYVFADNSNEGCAVPADVYTFTLYRAGLCKSFTSFPDDSNAGVTTGQAGYDTASNTDYPNSHPAAVTGDNCVTVFQNSSGSSVTINSAGETSISGGTTTPPKLGDTYTHVFAVVGLNLTYGTVKTFSARQYTVSNGNGNKCWTVGNATPFLVSNILTLIAADGLPRVACGERDAATAGYGTITQTTDCFEPHTVGAAFSSVKCFYQNDETNRVAVWVTDSTNLQKVTAVGDAQRLVFVSQLSTPVSGNIANLNLGFSTRQAVGLLSDSNALTATPATNLNQALGFATQGNFLFRVTTK